MTSTTLRHRARLHLAVVYCAAVIQALGVLHVLSHLVENLRLALRSFGRRPPRSFSGNNKLNNKLALVTGASRGIGLATAERLVRAGVHVLFLCRGRGDTEAKLAETFAGDWPSLRDELVTVIEVDLRSFASVQNAASEVTLVCTRLSTRLDFIICNAGVMGVPSFRRTEDGYEEHLQVNSLSHALLVHLLLKQNVVHDSAASRIVCLSSFASWGYSPWLNRDCGGQLDITTNPAEYNAKLAYAKSKWYLILLMASLSRTIERSYGQKATCVAVNPGAVNSQMSRDYVKEEFHRVPGAIRWLTDPIIEVLMTSSLFSLLSRRDETAAELVVAVLAADPVVDPVDGAYVWMGATGRMGRRRTVAAVDEGRSVWDGLIRRVDRV